MVNSLDYLDQVGGHVNYSVGGIHKIPKVQVHGQLGHSNVWLMLRPGAPHSH